MMIILLFLVICAFQESINGYRFAQMSLTLSSKSQASPLSAISPAHYGVNAGHKCNGDDSWIAAMQRLGVTKARLFSVGGVTASSLGIPTKGIGSAVPSLTNSYGSSLSGFLVDFFF